MDLNFSLLYKSIPYRNRPGLKPTKQQFVAAYDGVFQCEGEALAKMRFGDQN